jgi:hypothetical protein
VRNLLLSVLRCQVADMRRNMLTHVAETTVRLRLLLPGPSWAAEEPFKKCMWIVLP